MKPQAGDILVLDKDAGAPFGTRPIRFRVIGVVPDWTATTYAGQMWIDGYQLNAANEAVRRRRVYVLEDGLRLAERNPRVPAPRKEKP